MKQEEDKFEDFIKNQLSEVDPNASWNMPDDSNWDMIEAHLDEEDERRRFAIWWIPSSILLIIILGLGIYLNSKYCSIHTSEGQRRVITNAISVR